MVASRATSSQKMITDLKAPGLSEQVIELDRKALMALGRYRAICEGRWQGEVKEGEIIPYKAEPISKISAVLTFLPWTLFFLRRFDVLPDPGSDEMGLLAIMAGLMMACVPVGEINRIIHCQIKNNEFHKRLPPETQKKFTSELKDYFHKRISLFAKHPEEPNSITRKLISYELNYDMLRLFVDGYRFLDNSDPEFLASVTLMLDADFVNFQRFGDDKLDKLKKEYDNLRIEKRQHIR